MNQTNGQFCSVCGGTALKTVQIESGFLYVGEKLFKIKNYPGFICSDCKEEHIKKDLKELFENVLGQGHYVPLEERKIPVYNYSEETFKESKNITRVLSDGTVYCLQNVPFTQEHGYVEIKRETLKRIYELHSLIEKNEVTTNTYMEFVVVKFQ